MTQQEIILLCPNCKQLLTIMEDKIHAEQYCKTCGTVLRGPPVHGITYPNVIIIRDVGHPDREERCP